MSTQGWRKNTSVTRKLIQHPFEYQFLQVVRLLERSAVFERQTSQSIINVNPVAKFTPPESEAIRLKSHQSLAFHSAEVQHIERQHKDSVRDQWLLSVNLMGLTGSMGVLPFHYTELVLNRQKLKDETLEHFLDLFNHRTLSLFYQASIKYRLPLQYERYHLNTSQNGRKTRDTQTQALLSLIGLGTEGLTNRLYIKDESLIKYSGLLTQKIRNASNLKQILRSHFDIPVEIEQFNGQWEELIDDVRSRFPDRNNPTGCNVCLGKTAMLGKKGWFAQGKIHIILGPLNSKQLKQFAPGTHALRALNELVRLYVGLESDYDFIIRIRKKDIPEKIQLTRHSPTIIGWNAWLASKPGTASVNNKTVDISVSANRLN